MAVMNFARALSLMVVLLGSAVAQAAPCLPPSDDAVLARVPTRLDPDARALASLRRQLSDAPTSLDAAVAYAQAALKLGHSRADPRYYGYAQAVLAPWWSVADAPQPVLLLRATIRQFFHTFDLAQADLDRALARQPRDAQARLLRATVQQVQGRPQQALADCEQLANISAALIATTCAASASSLSGHAERADALLGFVLAQSGNAPSEARLWAETLRAEIAERLGRAADAQAAYQRALATMDALGSTDAYLLAAWGDFAIAQGQGAAVIARLQDLTDIDNLLLRLALAEQTAGGSADTLRRHRQMLEDRFAAARQRGAAVHLREEALYRLRLAGDAQGALTLAQDNWKVQREPLDALILLDAARAARQPDAAATVLDWMHSTGIEDQRLHRAAGALQ